MLKQECLNTCHLQSKSSHAKQFTILYSITSTSLLQLQRNDPLNIALSLKKDKKSTHFSSFCVTNEVKLSVFQYKIVHNILYTNNILYKMKKKHQPDCPYCLDIDQTPLHLFVECAFAELFWNKFTKWYNATSGENIALEQNEIIYGVLRHTSSSLTLNHLIIIGKYFLYINAVHDEKRPQFTDFVTLANEKMELEKYIATTTNKLQSFNKNGPTF